jgi:hypothetical protein
MVIYWKKCFKTFEDATITPFVDFVDGQYLGIPEKNNQPGTFI